MNSSCFISYKQVWCTFTVWKCCCLKTFIQASIMLGYLPHNQEKPSAFWWLVWWGGSGGMGHPWLRQSSVAWGRKHFSPHNQRTYRFRTSQMQQTLLTTECVYIHKVWSSQMRCQQISLNKEKIKCAWGLRICRTRWVAIFCPHFIKKSILNY